VPRSASGLPQDEEHDGADDRALDAPDAADHRDEDHENGPVVHAECGIGRDAKLLQKDKRAPIIAVAKAVTIDDELGAPDVDAPLQDAASSLSRIGLSASP